MKSILVIETPTNCYECPLIYWGNIGGWNCKPTRALLDDANRKPNWCPLKPLPKWKIDGCSAFNERGGIVFDDEVFDLMKEIIE